MTTEIYAQSRLSSSDRRLMDTTRHPSYPFTVTRKDSRYVTSFYATAEEAVAHAKQVARAEQTTTYVECDARHWVEIQSAGMVVRPWRLFYEGSPTTLYEQLMVAIGKAGYR